MKLKIKDGIQLYLFHQHTYITLIILCCKTKLLLISRELRVNIISYPMHKFIKLSEAEIIDHEIIKRANIIVTAAPSKMVRQFKVLLMQINFKPDKPP